MNTSRSPSPGIPPRNLSWGQASNQLRIGAPEIEPSKKIGKKKTNAKAREPRVSHFASSRDRRKIRADAAGGVADNLDSGGRSTLLHEEPTAIAVMTSDFHFGAYRIPSHRTLRRLAHRIFHATRRTRSAGRTRRSGCASIDRLA